MQLMHYVYDMTNYTYVNKIQQEVKNMKRIETTVWKKMGGACRACLSQ